MAETGRAPIANAHAIQDRPALVRSTVGGNGQWRSSQVGEAPGSPVEQRSDESSDCDTLGHLGPCIAGPTAVDGMMARQQLPRCQKGRELMDARRLSAHGTGRKGDVATR